MGVLITVNVCPVCDDPLGEHNEPGWPCDDCTEVQPMGEWVSVTNGDWATN